MTTADFLNMTGLEAMQAIVDGRVPAPTLSTTLGFRLSRVERGLCVFVAEPSERVLNPFGLVHGGFALSLIDSACGCAAHTTLDVGVGYTTLETHGHLVRALTQGTGPVTAEGRVVAEGRTVITAETRITDAKGRLYAHGTSTLLVLRPDATV